MEFEKAYVRDIISPFEYDEFYCSKIIVHFKTLASTLKDTVKSIDHFADDTSNMVAVDHVHPLLSDLFEVKTKMNEWFGSLSKIMTHECRRAADEFDLESYYNSFMASLPNAGT